MKNIVIESDISKDTLDTIQTLFHNLTSEQYFLHIYSHGGESQYAEKIAEMLLPKNTQFTGVGHILVASSALLIHQSCGVDRIATPKTLFYVHRASPKEGEVLTQQHLDAERSHFELFVKTTGRNLEQIYNLADQNKPMSTKEALDFGFITQIVKHPFPRE